MKKILLLTDFSEASKKAIYFTLQLYHTIVCKFIILNNYVLLPDSTGIVDEEIARLSMEDMNNLLSELKENTFNEKHALEGQSIAGNLYMTVSELYNKEPFDLLVVGATGSGNSVRLGSVATQLIRTAPCPVLVVPASTLLKRIENIVVATDYSNFQSAEVFAPVLELLTKDSNDLVFLSILKENESPDEVDNEHKSLMDQYFKEFKPLHYYIKEDSPLKGIEEYLGSHTTDLLVTVSHHRSLWDILLNRSTSRVLAYEAEVPLLVLNERVSDGSEDKSTMDWNVIL